MTRRNRWDGDCPFCGGRIQLTYYTSINSVLDPELSERVKDGTIFEASCPSCGETIQLFTALLYHDMENHAMVQLVAGPGDFPEAVEMIERFKKDSESMGDASLSKAGYAIRVVSSPNYLRDKAIVFAAGLDDRAVELCKAFLIASQSDVADKHCEAYVQAVHEDRSIDLAVFLGDDAGTATIPGSVYDKALTLFDSSDPDGSGLVIDLDWAVGSISESRSEL